MMKFLQREVASGHKIARACIAVVTALLVASPSIAKERTRYFFYARVTNSVGSGSPQPGTIVPMTIVVDRSFPASTRANHVTTYSGGSGYDLPSPILQAWINGKDEHGIFDSITITRDVNGVSKIEITSASPQSGPGFDVTFQTTQNGVVKNGKIPPHIFPGNFASALFTATLDPADQFSGAITQ
jgi:hypothetical protein